MREGWIRSVCGGMLFFMTVSALGCATATAPPMPARAVSDVKSVAGKWSGTGHTPVGTNPLNWTIKEDGTVEVLVATPTGPVTGVGKMSVKDGRLFYESGTSSGNVTLHEDGTRRVLRYDGISKRDSTRVGAELMPAR